MGRSVSYATGAKVITFKHFDTEETCEACNGSGTVLETRHVAGEAYDADQEEVDCDECDGRGYFENDDFDMIIDDMRDHLKHLFPSVTSCDEWLGREDHAVAENRLAYFGLSEYCGLVSYWIVPKESTYYDDRYVESFANRWIDSIADKFVAAFGELTKVGSMSNGEGVYRRIDR